MDFTMMGLFLVSTLALLGSPGPAIAALLAIGRAEGFKQGMRFNIGLQCGLAIAAAMSALGLFSIFSSIPSLSYILSIGAALYLLYLAYQIAAAPVGANSGKSNISSSLTAGIFLGLSNPKAYLSFVSLYASYTIYPGNPQLDIFYKWLLCVVVMVIVDTLWLLVGASLKKISLSHSKEKGLNIIFALMIVGATISVFL